MSKKIEELKAELKRERYDSLQADRAWQEKVSELNAKISYLENSIEILLANKENDKYINPNSIVY
jgi:hypothetical protein